MTQASRMTAGMSSAVTAEQPVAAVDNPQGRSPILLICEHASNRLPARYGTLGLTSSELESHIAWDPGALGVRKGALAAARCAADSCDRLAPRARSQPRAFRAGFDLDAERAHHGPRQSRSRRDGAGDPRARGLRGLSRRGRCLRECASGGGTARRRRFHPFLHAGLPRREAALADRPHLRPRRALCAQRRGRT